MTATNVIDRFKGEFHYLSNFGDQPVEIDGTVYRTSEHYYNAEKTLDPRERSMITSASTPGQAKRAGRAATLRPDWDERLKFHVMMQAVRAKFSRPEMQKRLLGTGDALLVEGNYHHDQCWGDCECKEHAWWPGQNHLGRILMTVRSEIRGDAEDYWPRASLTGHRPTDFSPEEHFWVEGVLRDSVAALRDRHGTRVALSGMALGADTWWAQAALAGELSLWAYVPFEAQHEAWDDQQREEWRTLRARAQREVVLGQEYDVRLFHGRNDLLLRDADVILAVLRQGKVSGGTASTVKKARAMGRTLILIDPATRSVTLEQGERYRLPEAKRQEQTLWEL